MRGNVGRSLMVDPSRTWVWARESEDHGLRVARKEEQERTCPTSKISSSEGGEGKLEKAIRETVS